jgi:hypothetical protein
LASTGKKLLASAGLLWLASTLTSAKYRQVSARDVLYHGVFQVVRSLWRHSGIGFPQIGPK